MPFVLPGPSYQYGKAVTKSDTPNSTGHIQHAVALYIGGTGDLTIVQNVTTFHAGVAPTALTTVLLKAVPVGSWITCAASWTNVNSTGTTASEIVAFY